MLVETYHRVSMVTAVFTPWCFAAVHCLALTLLG